jgi:glycerol-3-phosphate dehydrogenase
VFFAVPQGRLLLVGTTDDRYDGAPGDVRPTRDDAEYLLAEAQTLLPGAGLSREHIRYAYAGLRPLQRMAGGPEAAITRRHSVIDHGERGGPQCLLSVVGGKLSTFRPLAREVADEVGAIEGEDQAPAPADIHGSRGGPPRLRFYGAAAREVAEQGTEVVCEHSGAVDGEVVHAVRAEMATTLSDVLMRRTGMAWGACRGLCCHREVAKLAAGELGWSASEAKRQVAAFEADVAFHLPDMAGLEEGSGAQG